MTTLPTLPTAPADSATCRIATFSAAEIHELRADGWVRNNELSTAPVAVTANKFLAERKATPIFVSAPNITAVQVSDDKRVRTYMIQLAVIYRLPPENEQSFLEVIENLHGNKQETASESVSHPETGPASGSGKRGRGRPRKAVSSGCGQTRRRGAKLPVVRKRRRAASRDAAAS